MTTQEIQSFTKVYKYEIRPTQSQEEYLIKTFGHNRFIWNQLLEQLNGQYDAYMASGTTSLNRDKTLRPKYDFSTLSSRLTDLKTTYPWLNEVPSAFLQQTVRHLSQAYEAFFKEAFFKGLLKGYKSNLPQFKSKRARQSISLMTNGFSLDDKDLRIATVSEPIKVLWSRDLPSIPSFMTISKESDGRYYVSFTCEYSPPKTSGTSVIGLDLGIKSLHSDPNGHIEDSMVKRLEHIESFIKCLQRKLSHKVEGSMSYNRLQLRLDKWHRRLYNVRKDIAYKLSRKLINQNPIVHDEENVKSNTF